MKLVINLSKVKETVILHVKKHLFIEMIPSFHIMS